MNGSVKSKVNLIHIMLTSEVKDEISRKCGYELKILEKCLDAFIEIIKIRYNVEVKIVKKAA